MLMNSVLGRVVLLLAVRFIFFRQHPYVMYINANEEGDALYEFKQRITDDPNNILQSWDPTHLNPCTWFHVTCDNNNNVIRVDLANSGLTGQLVPHLAILTHLQYLILNNNHLHGIIPSELGNLTNLITFDLSENNFTGPVPCSLGLLKKCHLFLLNDNQLSGCFPFCVVRLGEIYNTTIDVTNNLKFWASLTDPACLCPHCPID